MKKEESIKKIDILAILLLILSFFVFPDKENIVYIGRIVFIFLLGIRYVFNTRLKIRGISNLILCWSIIFFVASTLSLVLSYNFKNSLIIWIAVLQCIIISYLLCWWLNTDKNKYIFFLKTISLSGVIFALRVFLNLDSRFGTKKISYILGLNANTIGYRFALLFIITLFLYSYILDKKRFKYLFILLLYAVMVLITGSRRALILIIIGSLLYFIFSAKNSYKVLKLFISSAFTLVAIYFLITKVEVLYNIIGKRMISIMNAFFLNRESILDDGRDIMISTAINLFKQKPFFGWGMGNFRELSGINIAYSHNNYAELLFATGLFGFVSYYAIHLYILNLIKKIKIKKSKIISLGLSLLVIMLISDMAAPSYYQSYLYIFFSIIIAGIGIEKCERTKKIDKKN